MSCRTCIDFVFETGCFLKIVAKFIKTINPAWKLTGRVLCNKV